ncbi:bifunctional chorismate mutase/prephenate dehydratase [Atopobium sp. oral taxon 416]|uniref:bifunctional chorismate mutase/prephenate dehydratase n=1 Tax=Atopobium sp. oral taxon 416 TaxID=712157 RepID=UPI002112367B|nr:bifunctional chorismate mutase/prephenate dehydratase [Atopobium sp. oral taxon 416]
MRYAVRDLPEVRKDLDSIDSQMIDLFLQRMKLADEVADYKAKNHLPILDREREREKLARVANSVPMEFRNYAQVLEGLLMEAARAREYKDIGTMSNVGSQIYEAIKHEPKLFPQRANVACQGVEGAYSQIATDRIFKHPTIAYFDSFEGVFRAVEEGFSQFGVLPVENSTAGTVNQVYDLMMEHHFSIVRSTRIKIDHNVLAKPGTEMDQIKDIYSHEQAIRQCHRFLIEHPYIKVHAVENTAIAARMVAESDRDDVAALSSRACAELYNLNILMHSVQDTGNNFTRFACITKDLTIYPGADRTSLMLIVNHEPGALYKVLSRFYALDINLVKLESRPIPDRDFEFMFYFDIECPAEAPEFATLINSLGDVCEEFRYLGSYREII